MNTNQVTIRTTTTPADYPKLVQIWGSAVDETHDFLSSEHRAEIESRLASDCFPHVQLRIAEIAGTPVGFAGVVEGSLEMLFVDSHHRGHGVGRALLEHAIEKDGVNRLDVNEQNTQAVGFYDQMGFQAVNKREVDDQGWPYPIVHMVLN